MISTHARRYSSLLPRDCRAREFAIVLITQNATALSPAFLCNTMPRARVLLDFAVSSVFT